MRYTDCMQKQHWRRINFGLLAVIILINGYILMTPLIPAISYWWHARDPHATKQLTERLHEAKPPSTATADTAFRAGPNHDGLIIPKMLLDTPLIEGPMSDSFNLLNKGAWRLPIASSPDKGGNTVIAGHRFSYTGPRGVFYYLNKLEPGDEVGLWYHGTRYLYKVQSTRTVAATEVSVQQPTSETRLTLYTCTPLWNPVSRLVVVATPEKTS